MDGSFGAAVQFLTARSFTGLHILTACVVSIGFAFLAFYLTSGVTLGVAAQKQSSLSIPVKPVAIPNSSSESDTDSEDSASSAVDPIKIPPLSETSQGGGEWKMVLLVRTDLDMKKGKAAAQCCHATLASVRKIEKQDPKGLRKWEKFGQAKITLKCPSEEEMLVLQKKARSLGIVAQSIRDAGRTQIAANSRTVCAVGPGPKALIDKVTGHLKLY
ncbi:Peptidyl-tRNA hydrolase protein 2, mitochondrial [Entophlyctis luteolus]|nr:Peptidyl-tRNA hydrolase protein 2, mitochondrial [Entophlyctis luteolus]